MKDDDKTKEQLLEEQQNLSERLVKLESAETNYMRVEGELLLIQKINNMLNAGVDQEEVFKTIVDSLRTLYDYDSVAIHFLSKDRKHLTLKSYSTDPSAARKLEKLTGLTVMDYEAPLYEGSLLKEIVDTKKPVITDDITWILKSYTDKKYLQKMAKTAARLTKARWGVGVPLMAGDKVVGTIGCGSIKKLTDKDAQRLANFGAQAGLAIERAKRTKEIEESEKKYSTLVEKGNDGIIIIQDGLLKFANVKMTEITGFSTEEILEKSFIDFVSPEYRELVMDRYKKRMSGVGVPNKYEVELLSKDGRKILAEINATIIGYKGRPADMAIIRDITEHKQAEEEIKRLKEFNEKIVQSMKEGIVVEDENGVIIYINISAEKMLGYTKDEIIGQHWSKIISKRFLKKVEKERAKQFKGITSRYECEVIIKNGRVVPIINSAAPLFEDDEFNGVLSVFTDITAEKEKEETVRKKLMKYRLDWGRIYYVDEPKPKLTLDAFLDLLGLGYLGAVLARLPPNGFRDKIHEGTPVLWLSEKAHKLSVAPEFKVLTDKIEDLLTTRRVILFQGLEYLISKHGYDNTLWFLQGLNELFYVESAVLLLSFDSRTLSRQQLALLKKEGHRFALKGAPEMPEKCLSLLRFVYERNSAGVKPSHKEVCKRFEITRNTAKARIRYLVAMELLTEKLKGRTKILELTEQGKDYL